MLSNADTMDIEKVNDFIYKRVKYFTFFEPEKINLEKEMKAFDIISDHLKYVHGYVTNKVEKDLSNLNFNHGDFFQIKILTMVGSLVKYLTFKNKEANFHDIDTFQKKIAKINKKLQEFESAKGKIEENLQGKLKSILDSITKPKLDSIYDSLSKGKDVFIIKIIESLAQLLLNKKNPHPQEVEKTLRKFDTLKGQMSEFNIAIIDPDLVESVYKTVSACLNDLEQQEKNNLFPSKKDYSNLIPFGKWIVTIIKETKNKQSSSSSISDAKINILKSKKQIYEKILSLLETENDITRFDIESKILEAFHFKEMQYETLLHLKQRMENETENAWNSAMVSDEYSINKLYAPKPKQRKTIHDETRELGKIEMENINTGGYFCGFCRFFK